MKATSPLGFATRVEPAPFDLSPIKEIEIRASRIPDAISLAQGIPDFDTPEPIKEFVRQKMAEGACARYSLSPGLPELRELVSVTLLREGMRYDPDGEILVTCGAIEAIAATLLAFVGPGDEVLVASPSYASYVPAIRLAGARPRFFPLDEDRNFDLDPDAIRSAVGRRCRAILLCNPNNPTGTIYSREKVEELLRLAERHGLLVIDDAVYKDFVYTDEKPGNPAAYAEFRHRVVRVYSFSKAFGMTGWRVAFLHTDRKLAAEILKVHDTLVTCAPVASQYAAMAALELAEPFVERFREELRRRRTRVIERLDALPEVFDYQKPNASYFAFPRVKDTVPFARDSRTLARDILERVRVALVPGVAFGPTGESHLRLCYARDPEDLDRAFDRLGDYFAGRAPRAYSLPSPLAASSARREFSRRAGVFLLHALSRLRLARQRPRIVAIAGGQGNTVLKRTLTELLASAFRVRSNPLSYNTDVGIAFAVLQTSFRRRNPAELARAFGLGLLHALFPEPLDVMVLELGVRRPGDVRRLLRVVPPDLVLLTPLAPSSAADDRTRTVLREELRELVAHAVRRGKPVLVSGDDPLVESLAPPEAEKFRADDLEESGHGAVLVLGDRRYAVRRDVVGRSARAALSASVRVARLLGASDETVRRFLAPSGQAPALAGSG
ncbi:MAG: hypothetical protein KatS3mg076_2794 [Candidatus Binatia bacterium]|nr:MAG: hypothetical protein KatS3mg076_2794 [Candidatus Binatia bacterium]